MPNRLAKPIEEAIVDYYVNQRLDMRQTAAKVGCDHTTCARVLRRYGYEPRTSGEARAIPANVEAFILDAYVNQKLSADKIAEMSGYSQQLCLNVLKRNGVQAREKFERVYTVNETFFDLPLRTQEQAYILGFITTDGNVSKNRIVIRLSVDDRQILEDIQQAMGSNHPLKLVGLTRRQICLTINSRRLVDALAVLGIYPNKTLTVKPCTYVPYHLQHHYWRGAIDGDGCIPRYKNPNKHSIQLAGTKEICEGFKAFVNQIIPSNVKVTKILNANCYQVTFGARDVAAEICYTLYCWDDVRIALQRKAAIAREIVEKYLRWE